MGCRRDGSSLGSAFQDEVAHTLTENRVLQNSRHPFLTVSSGHVWSLWDRDERAQVSYPHKAAFVPTPHKSFLGIRWTDGRVGLEACPQL